MNGSSAEEEKREASSSSSSSTSTFVHNVSMVAVAQICQSAGFLSAERSALEALSEIASSYLQHLGKSAHTHANSLGRTVSNVFDIIHAIQDLASSTQGGFLGASDVNRSLLKSSTLTQIIRFVDSIDEIPFPKPIPPRKFPTFALRTCVVRNQNPPFPHVPSWLPSFPHPATYRNHNPSSLQRREGSVFGLVKTNYENLDDDDDAIHPPGRDAFLASAASNSSSNSNSNSNSNRVLPCERPRVRFRIGFKENSLSGTLDSGGSRKNGTMLVEKRSSLCMFKEL